MRKESTELMESNIRAMAYVAEIAKLKKDNSELRNANSALCQASDFKQEYLAALASNRCLEETISSAGYRNNPVLLLLLTIATIGNILAFGVWGVK